MQGVKTGRLGVRSYEDRLRGLGEMNELKKIIKEELIKSLVSGADRTAYLDLEERRSGQVCLDGWFNLDYVVDVIVKRLEEIEFVSWVEPGENDEPLYWLTPREEAIASSKENALKRGMSYINDEEAYDDFITVHWGGRGLKIWPGRKKPE
jgi:hypothetical protein